MLLMRSFFSFLFHFSSFFILLTIRYNLVMSKINLALVGLNFGKEFANIYAKDDRIGKLVLCDISEERLSSFKTDKKDVVKITSFNDVLKDPTIDAVHLITPIPLHAKQIIAVLESGKHCACTVPMALTIEDLDEIIKVQKKSKKEFMLMETSAYTYQTLFILDELAKGNVGKIQFLRGSHYQDMKGWSKYWEGFPPMLYGTHAISPLRILAGHPIESVTCFGSGTMDEKLVEQYQNPYPVESVLIAFKDTSVKAEATRSLFETAREYQEGLFVYGSKMSFEWGFREDDLPHITIFKGNNTVSEEKNVRNSYINLPESIKLFTKSNEGKPVDDKELEIGRGAPHHGSHPHLVDEFLNLIIDGKTPLMDLKTAINVTAACIYAHQSALQDGRKIKLPKRFC